VYFESRRLRVNAFVDRHFSLAGSLALHRKALGWDVLRAPLNVALAVPYIGAKLMASIAGRLRAKRLSRFLASRRILLETAVGQEIEWLIVAELLELPFRQGCRGACSSAPASIRACMKLLLVTSSAWNGSHSGQSKVMPANPLPAGLPLRPGQVRTAPAGDLRTNGKTLDRSDTKNYQGTTLPAFTLML
jgi:hypothetical protein